MQENIHRPKGQNLERMEPIVTILESSYRPYELQTGRVYSLGDANEMIYRLNEELAHTESIEKGYRISLAIDYYYAGELHVAMDEILLEGRSAGLIDLLKNPVNDMGETFISYLKNHCVLTSIEKQIAQQRFEKKLGMMTEGETRYLLDMQNYLEAARKALNDNLERLPDVPKPLKKNYVNEPQNAVRTSEEQEEENYNMIDGVLNNTAPQKESLMARLQEKKEEIQQVGGRDTAREYHCNREQ